MPRKASTVAPAVRIRENQRRARARRKELIDDLKSRIREYETQGVMAASQVQEAAQKVLLDNRRLRTLLAKKGVPAAEVEAFLRGHDYPANVDAPIPPPGQGNGDNTESQEALSVDLQQRGDLASKATDPHVSEASSPSVLMDIGVKSAYQPAKNNGNTKSSNESGALRLGKQTEKDVDCRTLLPNPQAPGSDCYCPDVELVDPQSHRSETECNIAANILAGYQGHGDIEQARVALGCRDSARCSITNAALLHVLDTVHPSDT